MSLTGQDWWRWDDQESAWRALRTGQPSVVPPPSPGSRVLLVTSDGTLRPGTQQVHDILADAGYTVLIESWNGGADSDLIVTLEADVVVLTHGSSSDPGRFLSPTVGIVAVDSWRSYGMGGLGWQASANLLEVVDSASPLAAGITGTFAPYTAPAFITWNPDQDQQLQVAVSMPQQPNQAVVFAYDAGSDMPQRFATTRHVGLGFHVDGFANGLTAAARAQFLAAVRWALDSPVVFPGLPPAPTGLQAASGDARVTLRWDWTVRADMYRVARATTSGGPYTVLADGLTEVQYTDTTAVNGTQYFYVVAAGNQNEYGPNSDQVSATPQAQPSDGDRMLYTDSQIDEFRNRMTGAGPFYSTGQGFDGSQSNAPGDGQRALNVANTFISDPSRYTWYQTFNNGTSLEAWDPEPLAGYIHNMRAAWCYMTMPNHANNTAWRNAARDMLLSVAQHSTHDFSNSDMYSNRFPGFAANPIFTIAGNMVRALKTYDMLGRDVFTLEQLATLDRWFYSLANWMFNWFEREANNGAVPNLINGDTTPASTYGTGVSDRLAFDEGPNISRFSMVTNRHASCLYSATIAAAYLKYHLGQAPSTAGGTQPSYGWWSVDHMLNYAVYNIASWLRSTMHPIGFTYDFHRASLSRPRQGWLYAINETTCIIGMAKALQRAGDSRGWEAATTSGWSNTAGAPNTVAGISGFPNKNLHYGSWMMSRYVNDGWGRRYGGNLMVPSDHVHDVFGAAMVSARYPSDTLLSSAWRRSGSGFPPFGSSPLGNGSFQPRDGEQSMYLGLIELGGV